MGQWSQLSIKFFFEVIFHVDVLRSLGYQWQTQQEYFTPF